MITRINKQRRFFCTALIGLLLTFTVISQAQAADTKKITMVVWRGCEQACKGFVDYLESRNLDVDITIENVAKDKRLLPYLVKKLKREKPDLVLTWGTTVSVAILGKYDAVNPEDYLTDIPAVFMIVADPVGAKLVKRVETSDRENITGTLNRVSIDVQLKLIQEYLDPSSIGLIYNNAELNSKLNFEAFSKLAATQDFDLVSKGLPEGVSDEVRDTLLVAAIHELADANVDTIYIGSSSYLVSKSKLFTETASNLGISVVSSYEGMVRNSGALFSIANRYYNVGKLAGLQAENILFKGKKPIDLAIRSLARNSLFVNMEAAEKLQLYPPIQLLRFAELINLPD